MLVYICLRFTICMYVYTHHKKCVYVMYMYMCISFSSFVFHENKMKNGCNLCVRKENEVFH